MNNDQRDEKSHDEALSALYRTTREVEPPDWLDEKILTAAHTAVKASATPKTPRSQRRRGLRFWATPVALAATLIMAVGIVRLVDETGEWQPSMAVDKPAQTLTEPASEADAAPADQRASQPAIKNLSLPPPVPEKPAVPATPMMRMSPPSPAAPSAPKRELPLSKELDTQDSFQMGPALRDEETREQRQENERSPKEWLANIAELRRQGRIAEAETSLAEFRRRYPDYPEPIWEGID